MVTPQASGMSVPLDVPSWAWLGFAGIVAVLLFIDIVAHWGAAQISRRSAALWSVFWIAAGLLFGGAVWWVFGATAGHEYLAAYAMEKSLSLDNLFVFLLVFATLRVEERQQRRALYLGIFGALVFRGIFIWLGLEVLQHLTWVKWIFGAILLVAAIHAAREHPSEQPQESKLAKWLSRRLPVASEHHGSHLLAMENGKRVVTPLLVAIIVIELADVAFAVDSVPAVLSVTTEPFLVYTSNVFAILGLRSLYAVLEATIAHLRYLHWGIAAVLAFAAVKIAGGEWVHIPPVWSVVIIVACVGIATVASLLSRRGAPGRKV